MDIRTFALLPEREIIDDFGHKKFYYYFKCKKFYSEIIKEMQKERPGIKIILHHKRTKESARYNDEYYELWNPEHVEPMYNDEHTRLHRINYKHSDETKKKISLSTKGVKKTNVKPLTEERKHKISESLKGKKFAPWSDSRRDIHRKAMQTRKPLSKESCRKISISQTLRWKREHEGKI